MTSTDDGSAGFYASPVFEAIIGVKLNHLWKGVESWAKLVHPDDYERWKAVRAQVTAGASVTHKYRIILPGGRIRWIQSHAFPVKNAQGEIYRRAGLLEDITESEEIVAKMHAAVADKEALLKEMYHRVKNNLQIVSSLMRLQRGTLPASMQALSSRKAVNALRPSHCFMSISTSPRIFPLSNSRPTRNGSSPTSSACAGTSS